MGRGRERAVGEEHSRVSVQKYKNRLCLEMVPDYHVLDRSCGREGGREEGGRKRGEVEEGREEEVGERGRMRREAPQCRPGPCRPREVLRTQGQFCSAALWERPSSG